jgi:hypothetical protein
LRLLVLEIDNLKIYAMAEKIASNRAPMHKIEPWNAGWAGAVLVWFVVSLFIVHRRNRSGYA